MHLLTRPLSQDAAVRASDRSARLPVAVFSSFSPAKPSALPRAWMTDGPRNTHTHSHTHMWMYSSGVCQQNCVTLETVSISSPSAEPFSNPLLTSFWWFFSIYLQLKPLLMSSPWRLPKFFNSRVYQTFSLPITSLKYMCVSEAKKHLHFFCADILEVPQRQWFVSVITKWGHGCQLHEWNVNIYRASTPRRCLWA